MYYKKKHLFRYSLVFFSFLVFASFFWHSSSVFLLFSHLRRRSYRCSSILEPQCFFVCSMPSTYEMGEKRAQGDEGATQRCEMSMCICALIDYIFYLFMLMTRTRKKLSLLLPVYFESTRRFFLAPFLSSVPLQS
jgi:hypothetical protein